VTITLAQEHPTHPVGGNGALTKCNSCGAYRLCRRYEGLYLCVGGPSKCYRHRKAVKALKERRDG